MDYQKVKIWVEIYGQYCSWGEVSIKPIFDITNNFIINRLDVDEDGYLEEDYAGLILEDRYIRYLDNHEYDGDNSDYQIKNAIKVENKYYLEMR